MSQHKKCHSRAGGNLNYPLIRAWIAKVPACAGMTAFILLAIITFPALASNSVTLDQSTVTLITDSATIAPGKPFTAGIEIKLAEGWHTYTKEPGDAGIPTTIQWAVPDGFAAGEIQWPPHKTFNEAGLTTYGYEGNVILPVTIIPPDEIKKKEPLSLAAKVDYLVCKDICIPQDAELSISLLGGNGAASADAERIHAAAGGSAAAPVQPASESTITLPLALVFAFIGGIILNLMPCVFPVLSLKALKVARYSGKELAHARKEGMAIRLAS